MIYRRGLLLVFLGLAFFLRVWGLDFGLPYEFHPDENYYLDPVLVWHIDGEAQAGLNPSLFTRLVFKYTLLTGYWLWFALSPYAPSEQWLAATWFFARFWSVVFGVLTVALAYPVGKRLYGVRGGLLAVLMMIGLFLPVRESHFAVNDTTVAFFMLAGVYFSVRLFWRRNWVDFLMVGVVVGLAVVTKLTGWFTFVAVLAAYALTFVNWGQPLATEGITPASRRKEFKYLGLSVVAVALFFGLILVRSFKDLPGFVSRLINFFRSVPSFYTDSFKDIQMAPVSGWQFYLDVLGWGVGWLLIGVMIWAIGAVCWRRYRPGLVLVIFSLVFFGYISSREFLFARFLLPIVPPLVILAAGELSRLNLSRWARPRLQPVVGAGGLALILVQPVITSIWFDHLLTLPDTRLEATEWLIKKFPPDTVIVKEAYAVFPKTVLLEKRWPVKEIQINERSATRNDPDYFLAHKTDLIVLSNFVSNRARHNSAEEAARLAQLALLTQQAELIKTFSPYRNPDYAGGWFYLDELYGPAGETLLRKQPGPLLQIYRLPYENQPHRTEIPPISVPVQANFAGKMMLLGYDLPVRRANPGEAIPITLYWQALTQMDDNYVIFNHLLDAEQRNWGGYDRWPQETAKTTLWHPGEVVIDTFGLPVKADAPPGVYTIDIGLYNQADASGTALPLVRDGQPIDQTGVRLGPVKIGAPPVPAGVTVKPQHPLNQPFGQPPALTLLGYDLAQSDSAIETTLYWQSLAQTPTDWSIFAHLRDANGQTVAQKDGPAGSGSYPTSLWDAGEQLTDRLTMPLPPDLPSGRYSLVVGLYNLADGTRLPVPDSPDNSLLLTEIEVN